MNRGRFYSYLNGTIVFDIWGQSNSIASRFVPGTAEDAQQNAVSTKHHHFIPDTISLLDSGMIGHALLLSPSRITDIYLLALAVENDCRFVTFDRDVQTNAVKRAGGKILVVI